MFTDLGIRHIIQPGTKSIMKVPLEIIGHNAVINDEIVGDEIVDD